MPREHRQSYNLYNLLSILEQRIPTAKKLLRCPNFLLAYLNHPQIILQTRA